MLGLSFSASLLAFFVILLGAYTRITDAGLGCPDWPGCYGHWSVPSAAQALEHSPHQPLQAGKAWREMLHRYAASALGGLVMLLLLVHLLNRQQLPARTRLLPWLLLFMVIMQGLLGRWTVTWRLLPTVVMAHLLGGLAIFSTLVWLICCLLRPTPKRSLRTRTLRRMASLALLCLVLQISLGGWTSSNYAAFVCPDLPKCQDQWWPTAMQWSGSFNPWVAVGPNYEGGQLYYEQRVAIHVTHRIGAVFTAVILLLTAWLHRRHHPHTRLGLCLASLVLLQLALGVGIVVTRLELSIGVLHNAVATLLLATTVVLNHRVRSEHHE